MKYLLILTAVLSFLAACKVEEEPLTIIEPPYEAVISIDTINSGQFWGLDIGKNAPEIYATVQAMAAQKSITHLGVVGNVFTELSSIENSIPLYASIFLDEAKGTDSGIQISISEGKVSAIFTNAGTKLSKWPLNNATHSSVVQGDEAESVYHKLVNIRNIKAFEKKFERISIFNKNIFKPYDLHMSVSPQWYFRVADGNERFNLVSLNFQNGKLVSIYSKVTKLL